jgi:hypothetical protein
MDEHARNDNLPQAITANIAPARARHARTPSLALERLHARGAAPEAAPMSDDLYTCVFSDTLHIRDDGMILNIVAFCKERKNKRFLVLPDETLNIYKRGFASATPFLMRIGVIP